MDSSSTPNNSTSCDPSNSNNSSNIVSPVRSRYAYNGSHQDTPNSSTNDISTSRDNLSTNPFLNLKTSSQASSSLAKSIYPISNSHLLEFTKRKNWSHRIIDQLPDFYYVINPGGSFMYCSPSSLSLVGYSPPELIGRNIVDFIHVDDVDIFVRDIKQSLSEHQFKLFYRFRKKDDRFIMLEAQGHAYTKGGAEAKCFFTIARPYPLKATASMDKLLELKLENEVLRQRLTRLRGGDDEDSSSPQPSLNLDFDDNLPDENSYNEEDLRNSLDLRGGRVDRGASSSTSTSNSNSCSVSKREESSTLPQTPNTASVSKKKVSVVDIQVNVTTANRISFHLFSPPITTYSSQQRKHKIEDDIDRVCTECGKTDSPEWRKGPHGPKTLCNACGLRWAKKSRRESRTEETSSVL
ncbi:white collar 2 type of transcription factor [Basidiobolus ranarum]|uniref:White collar 2 type of transcription factor n=1 Tax=Basidiobolus ranarum TaxID=34480 RepID=A0ABR2WWA1_9FUNG